MATIYHFTGLGTDALAGLESARTRARHALMRMWAQTPPPIPCPARPQLPEPPLIEVGGERYGLYVDADDDRVRLYARGCVGDVEHHFLADLLPSQLLELTRRAEAWASELERLADEYVATVEDAIRRLCEYTERAAAAA